MRPVESLSNFSSRILTTNGFRSSIELPEKLGAALGRRPLWHVLALLVLATALPLVLSSLLMFNRLVANERATIRQNLIVSAKTLAGLVDNEIATHTAIASTLAHSPALLSGDLAAFWQEASRSLEFAPGAWLSVSDPQGQILINTLKPPGTPLPRHAALDVVQRGFAERSPQVGDLVLGPISQKITGFVEVPVFRDGAPLYSVSISLSPQRFLDLIAKTFTHGELVAILDRRKTFVARSKDHDEKLGTLSSVGWRAAMSKSPEGWAENQTLEGEWSLTGYAQTMSGWTTGVSFFEADIRKPLSNIFWSSALFAGILTILSLTLAWLVARNTNRGMRALARAARELGEGRPVELPSAPFAEAEILATTLAASSVAIKERDELLARANSALEAQVAERTQELVAEMKRREASETTLRQVQKMESVGQLTGGIAHDFNNMLTIIIGNLDTMQRRLKTLDNAAVLNRPVEAAMQGARSAAKLTHRLLAFARQQPLEPVPLNLNALVASLSDMLTRTVGEGIKVETVSAAGLWPTLADANQVESALINLAVNSRDAMSGTGKLTIETANTYLDEAYVAHFGDLKAGQYVMLSVTDTGSGIDSATLEKVFEPFFTTKDPGKGTGLGLAMVHGFIKQSGGHIRIYSEIGEGTTVKLYLPRLAETSQVSAVPQGAVVAAEPPRRAVPGETVLLVEDNPAVRDYAIEMLEELGYQVLAADGADQALQMLEHAGRLDLLFTDVVLGGPMNGRKLAEAINKLRPSLPVLFTTGYTRNAIVHQGRLDPGVHLLNKPYTQRDLAEKVRSVIGR